MSALRPKPADKAAGMKSAYERALERLEAEGIERPDPDALTDEAKAAIAEARRVTEARLAELEAQLGAAGDPSRGQSVFLSKTASCTTCHAIAGTAGPRPALAM